jgi:UDP-sugar transporter A1/2/3
LKILTTAFFSVLLLRKEIKAFQWLALLILMGGVVLVQVCSYIQYILNLFLLTFNLYFFFL